MAEIIQAVTTTQPEDFNQSVNLPSYLHPLHPTDVSFLFNIEGDINDPFYGSVTCDLYKVFNTNDLMLSGSVGLNCEVLERQLLLHQ